MTYYHGQLGLKPRGPPRVSLTVTEHILGQTVKTRQSDPVLKKLVTDPFQDALNTPRAGGWGGASRITRLHVATSTQP